MVHAGAHARHVVSGDAFYPPRALGVIVGTGFAFWSGFIAVVAAAVAIGAEVEIKTFLAWTVAAVFGALALVFGWWTAALVRLAYVIDDDALTIRWGGRRIVVPIADIQRVVPGRTLDQAHVRGLNWWGCHVGIGEVRRIGRTLFFATHGSPEDNVYVVTPERAYALTVDDQAAFAEAYATRMIVGMPPVEPQRAESHGVGALALWRDAPALGWLATGLIGCAALAAYVFAQYPDLPAIVELNFPESGGIVRVGERSELLRIAFAGIGIVAANAALGFFVHLRERAAAIWLISSAALLQAVLLGAAIVAIARA